MFVVMKSILKIMRKLTQMSCFLFMKRDRKNHNRYQFQLLYTDVLYIILQFLKYKTIRILHNEYANNTNNNESQQTKNVKNIIRKKN